MVALPLVGQYLSEPIDESNPETVRKLNTAIASIRAPFFSDWIELVYSLRKHLPKVGITPLFPGLDRALDALTTKVARRLVDQKGVFDLDPLRSILALRNATAHGGLPDEDEAARHLEAYVPVLHEIFVAFDFLGDHLLKVRCDGPMATRPGHAWIRNLRGALLPELAEEPLTDALETAFCDDCETVLAAPDGRVAALYPLAKPLPDQLKDPVLAQAEQLFLYDGHYGRVAQKKPPVEHSFINYLSVHHRAADSASCDRLKFLLDRRKISFLLAKADTAPWTIADNASDFSRRTLDDLRGTKYFPESYVPFEQLETHFQRFLDNTPDRSHWPKDTGQKRFVNGFVLGGLAGAGKTAFLARQVERLLDQPGHSAPHENPNLVLFLRGQGILVRSLAEGVCLFHDIAEKLGVAVQGAPARQRREGDFSSLRELLDHLHTKWKVDKLEGRRLILVLDALNEAPLTEAVMREAIELIALAACFPWLKIVVSLRQEWLGVFAGKLEPQETDPIEAIRPFLFTTLSEAETERAATRLGRRPPPVVNMTAFDEGQARRVYEHYQAHRRTAGPEAGEYRIPGRRTAWDSVDPTTRRDVLITPLHVHLFMEAFDGRQAEPVATKPVLFRHYVNRVLEGRPGLEQAIATVVSYLLQDLSRPGAALVDNDCHALRRAWEEAHSAAQARLLLNPVEALACEGLIRKRDREEGAAYGFVFQEVADYLIYRHLASLRPEGEDELAYWTRRAAPKSVFAEYAGAFGLLLRDWVDVSKLGLAAQLVESSPGWFADVVVAFLCEQAQIEHIPGQASLGARSAAAALALSGAEQTAWVLHEAGYQVASGRLGAEAVTYIEGSVAIREALWRANPGGAEIAKGLGQALCNLAYLLRGVGRQGPAEDACRRSVEITEALRHANPCDIEIRESLGQALSNLGVLLKDDGRVGAAEDAYRRSVEIQEALWEAHPSNPVVGHGLGMVLNNLGMLLREAGRKGPAEDSYRRCIEIYEALWKVNLGCGTAGHGLGSVLNNLGSLLMDVGRVGSAEDAFRRSVEVQEALWQAHPGNVMIGGGLGHALNNLGSLLSNTGRVGAAEDAFRRSVEVQEALWRASPGSVTIGDDLGGARNNLAALLSDTGRVGAAEGVLRRSIEIREAVWQANPTSLTIGSGLGMALNNLGILLRSAGRLGLAEDAYRRSVEICEALWQANPGNIEIGRRLGDALNNIGNLLKASGRAGPAEDAYRRSVEIHDALWWTRPGHLAIGDGLGSVLNNLGNLLRSAGRRVPAEEAFGRSIEIYSQLRQANRSNVRIGSALGRALNNLGNLVGDGGRLDEAEEAFRSSVEIHEALWRGNPGYHDIGDGLAGALSNLGNLLRTRGRDGPAEDAFRRSIEIYRALRQANRTTSRST
jgi:tetratricopeptide (TPR) repeat protein